jgi:Mn-containing catalase
LGVELSTIPPYLCALYSVIDRSTAAAKAVRDVAVEERLHMALVANLMNAAVAPARNREASTETTQTEKE